MIVLAFWEVLTDYGGVTSEQVCHLRFRHLASSPLGGFIPKSKRKIIIIKYPRLPVIKSGPEVKSFFHARLR